MIGNTALSDWPIIYCNESFISLFGWTRSDVIGKPVTCAFLHGKETEHELFENIRIAVQEREEYEAQTMLYHRDGKA